MSDIQEFTIGKYQLDQDEFYTIIKQFPYLGNISNKNKIIGPFDGKINSMYLFKGINDPISKIIIKQNESFDILFRCRVSQAFRYEDIVKEKILYPFLDGTFTLETEKLGEKIQDIVNKKEGHYIFQKDGSNPSIIPVQNLLYYYEDYC